jgi:colanic acid/amylovoran biosynthesis glycosyltransferase
MGTGRQLTIGYVLSVFPKLSESFVLNEINTLLNQGIDVRILSTFPCKDEILHDKFKLENFANRTSYWNPNPTNWLSFLNQYSLRFAIRTPIIQKPTAKLRCAIFSSKFIKISRQLNVDLFHSHFASEAAISAMYLSKELGIPFTLTVHAFDLYRGSKSVFWFSKKQLLLKLCREALAIVAISNYNRKFLMDIGVNQTKINVIHCGIDPNKFRRTILYRVSKQILCVARLIEKKGIRYLLEAIGQISSDSDLKLIIVGTGPEEKNLKELAASLGVEKKVQFLGDINDPDLLNLYERSSIFVLPCIISADGDRDGIPVALMEAMSMELPVISTNVSGIPELVKDGENGLLVKPKDSKDLCLAIQKLLKEPETCKRFGKEGRRTIIERFNIEKNASDLRRIFHLYSCRS